MKRIIYTIILFYSILTVAQENKLIEYTFKNGNEETFNSFLYIVNKEAIYTINTEPEPKPNLDNQNTEEDLFVEVRDTIATTFFSTSLTTITRIPLYKSEIIYSDNKLNKNYVFTGNTKKINDFNCQEVKLDLNGRKYTIWFTPEIEINYGPYKINNLPGLIIELNEEISNISIRLKSVKKLVDNKIFFKLKKQLLKKPALKYEKYEKKLTSLMCTRKATSIAKIKEMGGEVQFDETHKFYTNKIIDIPTKLVSELKKIN